MTLATPEIEGLEEIAAQTSIRINQGTRTRHQLGWQISPALERASAARKPKVIAEPKPLPRKAKPVPAPREPFIPVEIYSYDDLLKGLRRRVDHLGISRETLPTTRAARNQMTIVGSAS